MEPPQWEEEDKIILIHSNRSLKKSQPSNESISEHQSATTCFCCLIDYSLGMEQLPSIRLAKEVKLYKIENEIQGKLEKLKYATFKLFWLFET